MKRKAMALILSVMIVTVFAATSTAIIARSVSESNYARRFQSQTQAFWIAEAAANRALKELRGNFDVDDSDLQSVDFGNGEYSITITNVDSSTKQITASGETLGGSVARSIELVMSKSIPPDFYDYPLYSAGDVDFNGDAYSVTADSSTDPGLIYAGSASIEHPENISGTTTQDSSITPLARFDFTQLLTESASQGNVYDSDRLKEVGKGNDSFPTDFWYTTGDDGVDNDGDTVIDEEDEWVPNVVYVTTDLQLNGNIGTVGGFFVVVGDVITNPDSVEDTTLNGTGMIDGVIYTRGTFRVNGGGDGLNVSGGVWAGEEIRLNGNADIVYNSSYMAAIEALDIDAGVQVTSWEDNQKPYLQTP